MLEALPGDLRTLLTVATAQGEALGVRLWLVGGVVRDLLLGQPLARDADLAVEGEVGALAVACAAALGGQVTAIHAQFGTAAVEVPGEPGRGSMVLDLARTRVEHYPRPAALPEVTAAPIEADLIRRDFSVNAMALELMLDGDVLRGGRLLDPFDGQGDLAAGTLRLLHAASLRDDPTRLLRGVRLAARLGMAPEPGSSAQIAAALEAGYLGMLTHERVLTELCLALREPRPDATLRVADEWGVTPQILPGLTWDPGLAERCGRLVEGAEGVDDGPLVWAGLLLYGCDAATIVALAVRYPLPSEAAALLRQLGPLHALAPHLAHAPANSVVERLLRPYSPVAISVLHYAEPEAAAATAHYLRTLREMRAPLDGDDLRRLGVAPGPTMGRLLDELRAAALDGVVATRDEAEAWVLERVARSTQPSDTER